MRFDEAEFSIFDFETTGLYPYAGDKICEIGAIRVDYGGHVKEKFHTMVDPRRPISYGAYRVNGITDIMVRGQPTIEEVLPKFVSFIKDSVLVAYNAGFDLGFLEYAMADKADSLKSYHVIDALKLARRVFPGLERYNLGSVSHSLGICMTTEHRAMSDVFATWKVFSREVELLKASGVHDVEDVAMVRADSLNYRRTAESAKVQMIEDAIRLKKRLAVTYFSMWANSFTKRMITPHSIQRTGDTSYILAHCHLRDELRNFRLDCVIDVWDGDSESK
ncbi:MAG TPA: exonuclease domain-containing protein [Candidatus Omnitrophota bacterium]|nr:exonuclease domain-containing protein [Candidatus Omnitrophota bacterium]